MWSTLRSLIITTINHSFSVQLIRQFLFVALLFIQISYDFRSNATKWIYLINDDFCIRNIFAPNNVINRIECCHIKIAAPHACVIKQLFAISTIIIFSFSSVQCSTVNEFNLDICSLLGADFSIRCCEKDRIDWLNIVPLSNWCRSFA